jgi:hypothetical protein
MFLVLSSNIRFRNRLKSSKTVRIPIIFKTKSCKARFNFILAMKSIEFLWLLDIISKCYPRYYSNELLSLADDIFKWMNNELPEDSSTLIYLKGCFDSPTDALKAVWKEIQLIAGPLINLN